MARVLLCWLGDADLRGAGIEVRSRPGFGGQGEGPIAKAVDAEAYDRIVLLNNRGPREGRRYQQWLRGRCSATV